jgi:hypothetical protein
MPIRRISVHQLIKDAAMTDLSELQGEITALRCFVAVVVATLPLSSQIRIWPAFEVSAGPLRDRLGREELRGFERVTVSLSSKRVMLG